MLGSYRLILAVLVVLSHIGLKVAELNLGVIAVVGFYLVSGYVMTGLVHGHYENNTPGFYLDRAIRLLPQYLFFALATLAFLLISGRHFEYVTHAPTSSDLLMNAIVVPLGYYMFNGSATFMLIPPAWSLGAEVQFYLLLPLLLTRRAAVIALSLAIWLYAAFGFLDTDWFGFRLLPGVLFIFMAGSLMYDRDPRKVVLAVLAGAAAMLLSLHGLTLFASYNREIIVGLTLGTMALYVLGKKKRKGWDEALGALSYGVFLNHFLLKWMLYGDESPQGWERPGFVILCLIVATVTYRLIEKPALEYRKKLRRPGLVPVIEPNLSRPVP